MKAELVIYDQTDTGGGPDQDVHALFDITDPAWEVTLTLKHDGVTMNSPVQPTVTALPSGTSDPLDAALAAINPADSDAALKLLKWLEENGRVIRAGTLNGNGYMYLYREPKGSTRQGYTPGGTAGDKIVESALAAAKEHNAGAERGICSKCMSAVRQEPDAKPVLEDAVEGADPAVCTDDQGEHVLVKL